MTATRHNKWEGDLSSSSKKTTQNYDVALLGVGWS